MARVRGPGHPDCACDLVAATIAGEYLRRDSASCLNIRVSGGRGVLFAAGELFSSADFDVSAVMKQALASTGTSTVIEPFIAFEPMAPAWAQPRGSREAISLVGYATEETEEQLPRSVVLARDIASELERRRTSDAEWFWVGSDYEVWADAEKRLIVIRAEHNESRDIAAVREAITTLVQARVTQPMDVRVNSAGSETSAGLGFRMGSSGQTQASDQYGTAIPANGSGVGLHVSHPLNLGAWLLRMAARVLVHEGKGKAVMIHATWLPLETRPFLVRARNERGVDLTPLLNLALLDISSPPSEYREPRLALAAVRSPFDQTVALPWESKM